MEIEIDSLSKPLHQSASVPKSYSEVPFLSSLFFTWVLPAYRKSQQTTLQPEHLLEAGSKESVHENELKYSGTLLRTVFWKYKWQLATGMGLGICAGVLEYTLPLYMLFLESYLDSDEGLAVGLCSVLVLFLLLSAKLALWRAIRWLEKRLHIRMHVGLITLVYANILTSTTSVATSEVVNELEVDVERVADGCLYVFWITSCSTELSVSLAVLVPAVGPASYVGLGFLLAVMLANMFAASKSNGMYDRIMALKDERMKFSLELFSNIKMLKIAVWEDALLRRVKEVRSSEAGVLSPFMLIWSGMLFSLWSAPILATVVTFSANKWLFGEGMSVESAFTTIAVFYLIQGPLLWMPGCVTWLWSSKFMRNEKVRDERARSAGAVGSIEFTGATFSYSESGDPVLSDISLSIKPGEFIAIVGKVGSGKSSMVNALLGEMKSKCGSLTVNGSLAYTAALESWIQNATLQNNILFGKPLDPAKYQSTLQVCALMSDLDLLPGGDNTEIGEKGINLSGGQKARVSLARAVYQDADIYLLDDPLSSVDAHVGSHIFHNCFLGTLKGKTRILVTHNTNFLHLVDRVIVMDSGRISEISDFSHLHTDLVSLSTSDSESRPALSRNNSDPCDLMEDEDRKVGKVDLSVYLTYLRYSGGFGVFIVCCVALMVWLGARFLGDLSIKRWTEHPDRGDTYFYWYLSFGSVACLALLLRAVVLIVSGVRAGTRIHIAMLERLVRAPINLFYDVTPLGRVLNRLSKDQQDIEMEVAYHIGSVMTLAGGTVGTVAACVYFLPWVAVVVPVLAACALYLQQVFLQLARETTRMEHISHSPMVQQFTESVAGLKTVRCFGKQSDFVSTLNRYVSVFARVAFTNGALETWLMVWTELVVIAFVVVTIGFLVVTKEYQTPVVAALVITYMIPLGDDISDAVEELASLERFMISVERAHALTQ